MNVFDVSWHWRGRMIESFHWYGAEDILDSCLELVDGPWHLNAFGVWEDSFPKYLGFMFRWAACFSLVTTAFLALFTWIWWSERFAVNRFCVSIAHLIPACLMGRFCFWAFQAFIGGWEYEMQMPKHVYDAIFNAVGGIVCVSLLVTAILAIVGLLFVFMADAKTQDE